MKRILKWGLIGLTSLVALFLGINAWMIYNTGSRLDAALAAIQETGEPVYLTDIKPKNVKPEENAVFYLRRAQRDLDAVQSELLASFPMDTKPLHDIFNDPLSAEECEQIEEILAGYPHLYSRLEEAAACPHHDAALDYSQGIAMILDHLQTYRSAMRTLALRARLRAVAGETDDAMRDVQRVLKLSQLIETEPTLISYLVSRAGTSLGVSAGNEVLRSGPVDELLRQSLDKQLAALDSLEPFKQAMLSERACGVQTFQQIRTGKLSPGMVSGGPGGGPGGNWLAQSWLARAYFNDDEATYIDLMNTCIKSADSPLGEYDEAQLDLKQELGQMGYRAVLTQLLLPALGRVRYVAERNRAELRSLRVLNALTGVTQNDPVAEPRIEDLKLPAAAIADPFGNLPLVVRKHPDGWLVYSVGENLKDDGGKTDNSSQPPDIVLAPVPGAVTAKQSESKEGAPPDSNDSPEGDRE